MGSIIWSSLAGGFLGTLVLSTVLRAAGELGITRMDLPFLLGTTVTDNRRRAKVYGYVFHFLNGLAFAVLYGLCFAAIGRSGWWLGALIGALHALFTATVLVNVLLPVIHKRIGTPETAANEVAKLPAGTDTMAREKARNSALENAFAEWARKESACPSKEKGGDLAWFRRVGSMVEPFAKAAFALQSYQMSDVVATKFGYHLILVTDRRPGKEAKFDEVKEVAKDVFCDRLRENMLAQLRSKAQIVITAQPKR